MGSPESSESDSLQSSQSPSDQRAERSVLLGSFAVKGNLIADESMLIEGRVKGDVLVQEHLVRVGRSGRVIGEVFGNSIIVEGKVNGNLIAQEDLTLRSSAEVLGNLVAAQVRLEDGCKFRGTVDMDNRARRAAISKAKKKLSSALSEDQK